MLGGRTGSQSGFGGMDPALLGRIAQVVASLSVPDRDTQLLMALQPFCGEHRRKKVEEAEAEVARLEAAVHEIEAKLADPEAATADPDIYSRHAQANKDLENAMSVWELASMELDELQK